MAAQHATKGTHAETKGDLALLSLKAAIQLNRMLKEQHADPAPVKLLVEVLKRTPGIGSAPDPQRLSADPKAISLFSGAFVDAQKETMRTSEFLKRISDLIDGLESNDRERRKESQEQMRVFCLSLHDKVLADKFPYKETETVFGDGMRAVGLR